MLFALPAFAHESGEPHPHPLPPLNGDAKPLDMIKARAQQIKENVGVKTEMHGEAKMQQRASTSASTTRPNMPGAGGLKALVRMHGGQIRERFSNALSHLTKLMTRIDSRIEKMKSAGVDVSGVETLQVAAEASIDVAEDDIAAVRTYVEGLGTTTDRTMVKTELEAKINAARESIRDAHEAVRKLVKALVEMAKSNRVNATTTVEVDADDSDE